MNKKTLRRMFDLDEQETELLLDSLTGPAWTPRITPEPEVRYWPEPALAA